MTSRAVEVMATTAGWVSLRSALMYLHLENLG